MTIHYIEGDATYPVDEPATIVHIANDAGGWGRGFVMALSKRWKSPEESYRRWHSIQEAGSFLPLGAIQTVTVETNISVINMIAQHKWSYDAEGNPPIRYDALEAALKAVSQQVRGASIHMPRIGCGLAGGTWELIEPIIEATLADHEVYVYDIT